MRELKKPICEYEKRVANPIEIDYLWQGTRRWIPLIGVHLPSKDYCRYLLYRILTIEDGLFAGWRGAPLVTRPCVIIATKNESLKDMPRSVVG